MKKLILLSMFMLTGCATKDYQIYAEQTAKMIAGNNASEAACFLVLNEATKNADNSTKTALATQIDKCKKPLPKIEPPKKAWHGFW
jgi:uncharacterized lipoprotein YajG